MLNVDNPQTSSFCSSSAMGPRISFSNDFADSQHAVKIQTSYMEAPVSSDFEFSVSNFNTFSSLNNSAADDIFFMGKMIPLKEQKTTTLRNELLTGDDGFVDLIPQIPKSLTRWKDRFSLIRRSCNDHKKVERKDGYLESVVEEKCPAPVLLLDSNHVAMKLSEDLLDSEDLTHRDVKN